MYQALLRFSRARDEASQSSEIKMKFIHGFQKERGRKGGKKTGREREKEGEIERREMQRYPYANFCCLHCKEPHGV